MKGNIWLNGIMGVVIGDALGCPVQFLDRDEVAEKPVTGMRGYGTFNLPEGSWTDDSSMTLALLASIREKGEIDLDDIMRKFMAWMYDGEYTPYGWSYDIGRGTMKSVDRYKRDKDVLTCGGRTEGDNGNGSLMRILPACLFCYERQKEGMTDLEAVRLIHRVSGLTHNHLRAKIACGLYYFVVRSVLDGQGTLAERISAGLADGVAFYEKKVENRVQLAYYGRLRDPDALAALPADEIRSSGYVVDTIEAALWALLTTGSFEECLLKAVNLAYDADTVGAIAGGIAGLYYGYDAIPADWREAIKKREWIEELCEEKGA